MKKLTHDLQNVLVNEFGLNNPETFIDQRSPYFFHLKENNQNFMLLIKQEFPIDLLEILLSHCRGAHAIKELPFIVKENKNYALFLLPRGKLHRLTEEKITEDLQLEVVRIQKKLNAILQGTPYTWSWDLPYFFKTSQGLMYIDIESIQEGILPSILTPPVFNKLSFKERVILKINRIKKTNTK